MYEYIIYDKRGWPTIVTIVVVYRKGAFPFPKVLFSPSGSNNHNLPWLMLSRCRDILQELVANKGDSNVQKKSKKTYQKVTQPAFGGIVGTLEWINLYVNLHIRYRIYIIYILCILYMTYIIYPLLSSSSQRLWLSHLYLRGIREFFRFRTAVANGSQKCGVYRGLCRPKTVVNLLSPLEVGESLWKILDDSKSIVYHGQSQSMNVYKVYIYLIIYCLTMINYIFLESKTTIWFTRSLQA